jgi:hypothetical protein
MGEAHESFRQFYITDDRPNPAGQHPAPILIALAIVVLSIKSISGKDHEAAAAGDEPGQALPLIRFKSLHIAKGYDGVIRQRFGCQIAKRNDPTREGLFGFRG